MTTDTGDYDTIIIGAGPAGLFCALQAAAPGRKILILEKKPACGRKLLITGSGQCNLTHGGNIREFLARYGDHGAFLRPALLGFTNRDLIAFFESRGLDLETDENGKVFPATRKAADVLDLLLRECRERGVRVRCGEAVIAVERTDGGFLVTTGAARYTASRVVIATGGASYPATGSTGDGYRLAAALGHTVTPVRPALAPVVVEDYPFARLAGISFEGVTVSLFRDGRKTRELAGDLLFTHTGLSGPAVLHLSRYTAAGDALKVSFLPGMTREGLEKDLLAKFAAHGTRQVKTILADYGLPERFVLALLEAAGIPADRAAAHLAKKARGALIDRLTAFPFGVKAVGGFREAMVTAGGVALEEVDKKTMASKRVPGLYVIGEVLDVDGDTGGYNLQAAFSTAVAAARAITGAQGR
ncbi:NAD(P)/FAD-dependent oxidoreductase [Methanoculleus sp. FWC-SCC1]|uniref:NAD(P)/FAD-dependent oxidoreductase n=1 Tax=Methanoculleus frigidifontis TaxID=2584085 RepID=A0ABT8MC82_9EURY|nr:NAD(P)/FAD-dependent oxidoreductase [Methanoculleus sp. FWC-SCC1]MDN7025540.1 NAD(P)/FAD-dependent oxidoreductase [Methanoculleus sp. FWC-SCC1]